VLGVINQGASTYFLSTVMIALSGVIAVFHGLRSACSSAITFRPEWAIAASGFLGNVMLLFRTPFLKGNVLSPWHPKNLTVRFLGDRELPSPLCTAPIILPRLAR
jgi:hypothetical protein